MCQHEQILYVCGHKSNPYFVLECEEVKALLQEYWKLKSETKSLRVVEYDYDDSSPYPDCCPAEEETSTNVQQRYSNLECMECLLDWLMETGGLWPEIYSCDHEAGKNEGKLILRP